MGLSARTRLCRVVLAAAALAAGGLAPSAQAGEVVAAISTGASSPFPPLVTTFAADAPGTALAGPTPVTGLLTDERPQAIDYRPAGGLYMLGVRAEPVDSGHLYRLDPVTGVATPIGGGILLESGNSWDIDFDPVTDRIRALGSFTDPSNFRIDPDTGLALLESTGDPFFAPGDPGEAGSAFVAAGAYTNSLVGATTTTAYALTSSRLARLGAPGGLPPDANTGVLTSVGTFIEGSVSAALEGLDISGATGKAYALLIEDVPSNERMQITEMSLADASTGPRVTPVVDFAIDIAVLPTSLIRFGPRPDILQGEGDTVRLAVERGGTGSGPVSVAWSIAPQSAAEDLAATAGTVSFGQGETSKGIEIPITDDRAREGPETFSLSLVSAAGSATEGAVVDSPGQANFTIAASDGAGPRVRIGPKRVRLTRRGRARLRVSCPTSAAERCTGSLKLKLRKRTIGKRRFNVAAGKSARLRLKVSRRGRRAVAAKGRLRVNAVASVRDAVSTAARSSRGLVLLPAR